MLYCYVKGGMLMQNPNMNLVCFEDVQKLLSSFYQITNISHQLLDEYGNMILSNGIVDIESNNTLQIPVILNNIQIATFIIQIDDPSKDPEQVIAYFEHMAATISKFCPKMNQNEYKSTILQTQNIHLDTLDNLPLMVTAKNSDQVYTFWNKECERITGYHRDQIINNPHSDELLFPDKEYRKQLKQVYEYTGDDFRDWEVEITCKNGQVKTVLWYSISQIYPISGWKVWSVGVNVTERKKYEEELKVQKTELESIFTAIPDMYFLLHIDGTIMDCKAKDPEEFYVPEAEFMWRKTKDVLPADVSQKFTEAFEEIRKTNDVVLFECSLPIKNKEEFYEVRCIPYTPDKVIVVARNITERKCMEESLRVERNIKAAILDTVEALVIAIDTEGRICSFNRAFEKLSGYTFEEIKGQYFQDIFIPKGNLPNINKTLQMLAAGILPVHTENIWVTKNGEKKLISWENSILYDYNGKIKFIIGAGKDITEQRKTEEYLRKSEKLSAVSQLAAGVAHEVRNPLTVLKGFIQLLQTAPSNEAYYELMLHEIERIETIISEFLSLAKPEVIHLEKKNVNDIIQKVVSLLNTKAIMQHITIIFEQNHQNLEIYCNENQLKQVFINILQNSIEAMPSGGKIYVSIEYLDDEVKINFVDQGCGISQERLERLGEPFYSTKEKGTGLGLMISNKIIENHKGEIIFSSSEGVGTTVEIHLPIPPKK